MFTTDRRATTAAPGSGSTTGTPTGDPAAQEMKEVAPMTLIDLIDQIAPAGDEPALPCQQQNPELWFAESPADVERAKAMCLACPLQQACLAGAIERSEPWGVWGGELFVAGAIVARKRPRGRPRKHPVAA